jgi:hypothetical protein
MRVKIGVVAAAAAALVAAGCGGSAGGNKPASQGPATIAPGSSAAYVWVDTNVDSSAWTKAAALLDKFPAKDKLLAKFNASLREQGLDWEADVKPALGDETAFDWLDTQNNGDDMVVITKPKDRAKFLALLQKSKTPPVYEDVDGYLVVAQKQAILDRFDQARNDSGPLGDDSSFAHFSDLNGDSIAKAWVRGDSLQAALDKRLQKSGLPAGTTKSQFGTLEALTSALTPTSKGVQIDATFSGNLDIPVGNYSAELPTEVPGGAIAYVSFDRIGDRINNLIDKLGASRPDFDRQRAQIELVLGYTLKDVFGLLNGEGGLAVYSAASGPPGVLFVAKVDDESKARNILDRLATLAAASGRLHVSSVQIGSVAAKQIDLGNGTSAYAAVFDGKLVATNSKALVEKLQGDGPKLADDSAYKDALSAAGMPAETSGFLYADTQEIFEYGFDYVKALGGTVPQAVKDNSAPLGGLLLYGSKDGSDFTLTGFLGIE